MQGLPECAQQLVLEVKWCCMGGCQGKQEANLLCRKGFVFSKDLDSAVWGAGVDCGWVTGHAKSFRLLK